MRMVEQSNAVHYLVCVMGVLTVVFLMSCRREIEVSAVKPAYDAKTTCFKPLNFGEPDANEAGTQWCEYFITDHPEVPSICWAGRYPNYNSATRFAIPCSVFEKVQKLSK